MEAIKSCPKCKSFKIGKVRNGKIIVCNNCGWDSELYDELFLDIDDASDIVLEDNDEAMLGLQIKSYNEHIKTDEDNE